MKRERQPEERRDKVASTAKTKVKAVGEKARLTEQLHKNVFSKFSILLFSFHNILSLSFTHTSCVWCTLEDGMPQSDGAWNLHIPSFFT